MRLQGYITEGRSTFVDEYDAIEQIRSKCQDSIQAYKKGHRVYRGINDFGPGMFRHVEPKKFTRESRNTANLYTLVIDNHPKWKSYPKRSESIICSSSKQGAAPYGNLFCVFPEDGYNFGVCPSNDIWGSFSKMIGRHSSLMEFNNHFLDTIAGQHMGITNPDKFKNLSDLKRMLKEMDKRWVSKIKPDDYLMDVLDRQMSWLRDYRGDFYKLLQEIFVPEYNGFKQTNNLTSIPSSDRLEVWTDSPSYLVNEMWVRERFDDLWMDQESPEDKEKREAEELEEYQKWLFGEEQ